MKLAAAGTPAIAETSVRAARSSATAGSVAAGMLATATSGKPSINSMDASNMTEGSKP